MATATATARTNGKPREFTCRFVSIKIEITDIRYSVDPIPAGEMGTHAFRLTKHAGDHDAYDVIRTNFGLIECTCADFEFRPKGDTAEPCRHGRALVELGLIPGPTPALVSEEKWAARSQAPRLLASIQALPTVEPTPCPAKDCQRNTCDGCRSDIGHGREPINQPADTATAMLERGLTLATAEVNQPVALPDHFEDEAPALDHFEEWQFFRDNPAALPAEPYEPTPEDEADFGAWKQENAARGHLDHSDRLTLAELVDRQSDFYHGWGNPAGEMIARAMDELALKIRMTGATTPDELDARVEILEQDIRHDWEARGYEEGRQHGRHEAHAVAVGQLD